MKEVLSAWKARVRRLKGEVLALYLAYRDPRVPWTARLLLALVVGYALSPIDLVPDFIPLLGLLDDLLLLPLGLWLALRLVPAPLLQEARARAAEQPESQLPVSRRAAMVIILLWMISLLVADWAIRVSPLPSWLWYNGTAVEWIEAGRRVQCYVSSSCCGIPDSSSAVQSVSRATCSRVGSA